MRQVTRSLPSPLSRWSVVLFGVILGGCANLGAVRIAEDRSLYIDRLRDSEDEELLSNIVGLSQGRTPLFLDVSSVINQFSREASGNFSLKVSPTPAQEDGGLGGAVVLRETPTITYAPVTGDAFAQSMLSPIPPASLLAMMESGWVADDLLRLTARSINGVSSSSRSPLFEQAGSPNLQEVIDALRRLQRSGAISFAVSKQAGGFTATAHLAEALTEQDRADLAFLRDTLKVAFDGKGAEITFASVAEGSHQIAIATRTMLEVLSEMSQGVDSSGLGQFSSDALIRIHSGAVAPSDMFCKTRMKGRWYWIAADDQVSKRRFLLTQILLSLTSQMGGARAPLVTVPVG